jgi:hypothetical protein
VGGEADERLDLDHTTVDTSVSLYVRVGPWIAGFSKPSEPSKPLRTFWLL